MAISFVISKIMIYKTCDELMYFLVSYSGENGPCGYVLLPVDLQRTLFIWLLDTDLKVIVALIIFKITLL